MTPRELIDCADIVEVWEGLGGGPLRRNKGCAWWRGSESWSVSISHKKNAFFDFGPREGGGVLALVQCVRDCDKVTALEWLASFYGTQLDNHPLSTEQRREWQRKRAEAGARASELVEWREALLCELRHRRNDIWDRVAAAERFGRAFVNQSGRDDLWTFAFSCLAEEAEGVRLDSWIVRVEDMSPDELIALRHRMAGREAVAA